MSIISTYTGKEFDLADPQPEMFDIVDIARGLSNQGRFAGHTDKFYSVAQHSTQVADVVEAEFKLAALLHDLSEAYLCDIPAPLKAMLPEYQKVEAKVMQAGLAAFGLDETIPVEVKTADLRMLVTEHNQLRKNLPGWGVGGVLFRDMLGYPIQIHASRSLSAEIVFLTLYRELTAV